MVARDAACAIFAHADARRKTRPRFLLLRAHARFRRARHHGPSRRAATARRAGASGAPSPDRRGGFSGFRPAPRGQTPSVEATETGRSVLTGTYRHPSLGQRAEHESKEEAARAGIRRPATRPRCRARRSGRCRPGSGMGNSRAPENRSGARASHRGEPRLTRSFRLTRRASTRERGGRRAGGCDRAVRDVLPATASIPGERG